MHYNDSCTYVVLFSIISWTQSTLHAGAQALLFRAGIKCTFTKRHTQRHADNAQQNRNKVD